MYRALALLLILSTTAHAEKSKKTAQALSVGGASVAGAVVLTGFMIAPKGHPFEPAVTYTGLGLSVITPSLGEFYAGEWFTPGLAVRVGAVGLATYALGRQVTATCDNATMSGQTCKQLEPNSVALLGVAAIAFVGGVWYDTLDAGDAVDRYNARHAQAAPTILPTPSGPAPGVMLVGYF